MPAGTASGSPALMAQTWLQASRKRCKDERITFTAFRHVNRPDKCTRPAVPKGRRADVHSNEGISVKMKKKTKDTKVSKTKIQIKSIWGSLLFEHESETIEDAVLAAVKAGANLRSADLRSANLSGANLYGANLSGANLSGVIGLYPIVPEEGAFIGFKKLANGTIAKILIPEDAERAGGFTGRKCRAQKAVVIEGTGFSQHNSNFEYKPGAIVVPDSWDPDPRIECSHGIHFFITRKEAEDY